MLRPRPDEAEYERIAPTYPDTAAAQWELAQWCREHKLTAQRQVHLRRVIELEPNHAAARHALGYSRVDGQWVTQEEAMTARGFVRQQRQMDVAPGNGNCREQAEAGSGPAGMVPEAEALARLAGDRTATRRPATTSPPSTIPMAVKGLALGLRDDRDPQARMLFVAALAKIDAPEAARAMAIASIYDSSEEVRLTCLDSACRRRSGRR